MINLLLIEYTRLQVKFVLVALQRNFLQDYRSDLDKRPLFKQGMTKLNDLGIGDVLTGLFLCFNKHTG